MQISLETVKAAAACGVYMKVDCPTEILFIREGEYVAVRRGENGWEIRPGFKSYYTSEEASHKGACYSVASVMLRALEAAEQAFMGIKVNND